MRPGSNAPQGTRARKPGQRRTGRRLVGSSAEQVAEDQRRRLIAAVPAALAAPVEPLAEFIAAAYPEVDGA
jgi:hypothetical protein